MKQLFALAISIFTTATLFAQSKESAVVKTMNERYELASAEFKQLLKTNPSDGDLYFYAGDNYFYWGVLDSAEMMFRQGIEKSPANPLNYVGLGRIGWVKNNEPLNSAQYAKAIEIMSTKSNKIDKKIQQIGYLKMAETYIQAEKKNFEKALEYINKAITFNEADAEAFVQLGDYYLISEIEKNGKSGMLNLSQAQTQYAKATQLNPTYPRALLAQGKVLVPAKNWDAALEYFNKAIAADPNYAPAYREKAELLYKAGRNNLAVENYGKYLELNNNCRVQQRYASFVFQTKDYKRAVTELEKALPCNTDNPYMYRLLGYSYFETGDFAKGLTNINKFFEMAEAKKYPEFIGSDYAYKGKLLAKSGQDSLGIITILKAIEIDPSFTEGYSDVAGIYFKAKKYNEAAKYYDLKIQSLGTEATPLDYYYLGQAYYFSKEYQKSDAAFAIAVTKYPDSNFWRGRCNFKLDNQEMPAGLANEHFHNFVKYGFTDAKTTETNKKFLIESLSYLGFYYATQKNFDCSKSAWNKVLELDANNEKAKIALTDAEISAAAGTCDIVAGPAPKQ